MYQIKVVNAAEVQESLEKAGDRIIEAVIDAMQQSVMLVKGAAKLNAPVDKGEMRNDIASEVKVDGTRVVGRVFVTKGYAIFVELGTGPVAAAAGSADLPEGLSITYSSVGWVYYDDEYGYVYTEGQPPRPFLYPAFKVNEETIKQLIRDAITQVLRGGQSE